MKVFCLGLAATMLASPGAVPAEAGLLRTAGPTAILTESRVIDKFDVAFDSANQVYLVVWGTMIHGPTNGQFLSATGTPIGGPFKISDGGEQAGWARVTYGGGKFLVAYTKVFPPQHHQRAFKFVTYQGGSPAMSAEVPVDTWVGGAGDAAGVAYSNGRFLVTWWNWDMNPPQSYVSIFDANGNPLAHKIRVTTAGDGQTDPEIACDSARGRCLIVGQQWGTFNPGWTPGTWGQFIRDDNGAHIGGAFTVSYGAIQKETMVTYSAAGDRYLVAYSRHQHTVFGRSIDGSSLSLGNEWVIRNASQSPEGVGYGRPVPIYNPSTQSTIVAMRTHVGRSSVLELNGQLDTVAGTFQLLPGVNWTQIGDEKLGTQVIAAAGNPVSGGFLVTDVQAFLHVRSTALSVSGSAPAPPPPPPPPSCSYTLSASSASFGSLGGSGGFTVTTDASCNWSATSSGAWLTLSGSSKSGTGTKTLSYSVVANTSGSQRTGTISVGGKSFTVTQAGLDPFTLRERSRADFDRDGSYDVIWQNTATGQLAAWLLSGVNVRSEAGVSHSIQDPVWEVVGTGDFNQDGMPDLVWRHKKHGYLGVWFMNGLTVTGIVSLSVPQVADIGWKIVTVADFNRDGHPDIVWQHDTGPVVFWAMQGTTVLWSSVLSEGPGNGDGRWRIVAAADMNADGYTDLLWQHEYGWLATWLMIGSNVWQVRSLDPSTEPETNWRIVGTTDANRDGRYDIIWQHVDGSLRLWAMNGLSRVYSVAISGGSLGGPNWKVVGPR